MTRSPAFRYTRYLLLFAVGLVFAGVVGCANYRLGTGAQTPFKTLYVEPVQNDAALPEAVAVFTNALRQSFVTDGRVALAASPGEADAVLKVSLVRYNRTATTARPNDTGLGRKFDLDLKIEATLHDNRASKDLFEKREFRVTRQIFSTATPDDIVSVQQQAEFNTQPLLAQAAAETVSHAVLDTW